MIHKLVLSALSSLDIPISADVYRGSAKEYITFNFADERPAVRADDIDIIDEASMQIHYFTKSNPLSVKRRIRQLLRNAGFTIIALQQFFESDTNFYHVVVEVWIESPNLEVTDGTLLMASDYDLFFVKEEE